MNVRHEQSYEDFLYNKSQVGGNSGFDPLFVPDMAFDFQKSLLEWAVKKGRGAVFADCGLGKSLIELAYAQNVVEKTNGNVLLLTPLAVGIQMGKEAEKFGIEAKRSRDGKIQGKITIANYEKLHYFNSGDFSGVICDESSILKNFQGKIKHQVNIFMRKIPYRLLATATAAPNDFIELGTSSEALGYLGYMDMLNKFFKNDLNNSSTGRYRGEVVKWRLKSHAHKSFWRWITSWARAVRFPSDIGFSDDGYILPDLIEHDHCLDVDGRFVEGVLPGMVQPAVGLDENRQEIKATIKERCEKVAEIVNGVDDYSVSWCNRNQEGDLLEKLIDGAVQVSGKDKDESKEEKLIAFSNGEIKKLITKPKIGAWGLNWQHCNHLTYFPTYSFEQYYQAVRRNLRFGQKRDVTVDRVYTEGSSGMVEGMTRKQKQADEMFVNLVKEMNNSLNVTNDIDYNKKMEIPKWL
jgi:SNF2 family DNA or RNA helicase